MPLTKIDDRGLTTPVDLLDNEKIRLGTGNDLQIYHDGNNSFLTDSGTGNLFIRADNNLYIQNAAGNEEKAYFESNGGAHLYHDNSKKFETTSGGATVTGTISASGVILSGNQSIASDSAKLFFGASNDLEIYHDGSNSFVKNSTGYLNLNSDLFYIGNAANNETYLLAQQNAAVSLYYDNSKKFETTSTGVALTGNLELGDDERIVMGDAGTSDSHIRWDGNHLHLGATGSGVRMSCPGLQINNYAGTETLFKATENGSVELYHDNTLKFFTGSNGVYHDCNGTLHQQAIHFETGQGTGDYSTVFGVTNYPDASAYGDQNDGHWARIQAKGGCVVVINSDGAANSARNDYDHFSIYQKANDSTNGRRLFSVDGNGAAQFGRAGIRIDNAWAGQPSITVQRDNNEGTDNTNDGAYMRVHGIGETHGSWTGGSTGADFSCNFIIDGSNYHTSDRRAKTDIVDCPYGLDVVNKLQPRKYQLVNSQLTPQGPDNINLGFIAQEIKEHIPECVNYLGDAENIPNEKGWARAYALDIGEVIPVLVKAIQELSEKVKTLETKVAALEAK